MLVKGKPHPRAVWHENIDCFAKLGGKGSYKGWMLDGKRHGQGKHTFPSGRVYEGEFKDGELHQGKITYPSGAVDGPGEFRENELLHGHCKRTLYGGDVHEGEYKDGRLNGQGKKTYPNGDV